MRCLWFVSPKFWVTDRICPPLAKYPTTVVICMINDSTQGPSPTPTMRMESAHMEASTIALIVSSILTTWPSATITRMWYYTWETPTAIDFFVLNVVNAQVLKLVMLFDKQIRVRALLVLATISITLWMSGAKLVGPLIFTLGVTAL